MREKLSDSAVISFLKIIIYVNRSPALAKYREHEGLMRRMPGFRVRMGFGLHVGWAIEGAIGSQFKIDASYLSPNVNMAARLEAATKQYGIMLLLSGDLVDGCTAQMRGYCRQIDRVTVKGSAQPMGLYTVDIDPENLPVDDSEKTQTKTKGQMNSYKARRLREKLKVNLWAPNFGAYVVMEHDPDMVCIRKHVSEAFLDIFRRAYQNYEAGEWCAARDMLRRTINMRHAGYEDGPSRTLLSFIRQYNFKAPEDWAGYRELTEK